jgi:hypothetical protein
MSSTASFDRRVPKFAHNDHNLRIFPTYLTATDLVVSSKSLKPLTLDAEYGADVDAI